MVRKSLLIAAAIMLPCFVQADVSVSVQIPGITLQFGDRDSRGYYWDGGYWRSPGWWSQRYPRYVVKREIRYYPVDNRYWRYRDDDDRHHRGHYGKRPSSPKGYYRCPPGQAKKGRC